MNGHMDTWTIVSPYRPIALDESPQKKKGRPHKAGGHMVDVVSPKALY